MNKKVVGAIVVGGSILIGSTSYILKKSNHPTSLPQPLALEREVEESQEQFFGQDIVQRIPPKTSEESKGENVQHAQLEERLNLVGLAREGGGLEGLAAISALSPEEKLEWLLSLPHGSLVGRECLLQDEYSAAIDKICQQLESTGSYDSKRVTPAEVESLGDDPIFRNAINDLLPDPEDAGQPYDWTIFDLTVTDTISDRDVHTVYQIRDRPLGYSKSENRAAEMKIFLVPRYTFPDVFRIHDKLQEVSAYRDKKNDNNSGK